MSLCNFFPRLSRCGRSCRDFSLASHSSCDTCACTTTAYTLSCVVTTGASPAPSAASGVLETEDVCSRVGAPLSAANVCPYLSPPGVSRSRPAASARSAGGGVVVFDGGWHGVFFIERERCVRPMPVIPGPRLRRETRECASLISVLFFFGTRHRSVGDSTSKFEPPVGAIRKKNTCPTKSSVFKTCLLKTLLLVGQNVFFRNS